MSIITHQVLVRVAFPLGMVCAVALFWVLLWVAFGVLRLPSPGDESAANVISALALIAWFFYSMYAGGRLAVRLMQTRALARCPSCGEEAVGLVS